MSEIDQSQAAAAEKSKKLGIVPRRVHVDALVGNTMSSGSGAGGGFGLNAPGKGPKVQHFAGGGGGGGRKAVEVHPAVREAWVKVLDDEDPSTYIICKYSSNGKTVELSSTGTGGLTEFKAELADGEVAWCGLKCYGVDNRGSVVCKRPKYVFIQWFAPGASAMKKAKMGPHKEVFTGIHLDVTAESLEDLDPNGLVKKLQAATGAHKPNGYEFDTGDFIADDFYGLGIGSNCKGETATA